MQGGISQGALNDVLAVDSLVVVADPCTAPALPNIVAEIEVRGFYGGTTVSALSFTSVSRVNCSGAFFEDLSLYEWGTNAWVLVVSTTKNKSFSSQSAIATNPSAYVGPFGLVVARARMRKVGPASSPCPGYEVDQFTWDVQP